MTDDLTNANDIISRMRRRAAARDHFHAGAIAVLDAMASSDCPEQQGKLIQKALDRQIKRVD